MTAPWSLGRGATLVGESAARFEVWAPHAARVALQLGGAGRVNRYDLEETDRGVFQGVIEEIAPGTTYRFTLDDNGSFPDPVSRWQPDGVAGPSAVVAPDAFEWLDSSWTGPPLAEYVIYEVHVGTATRGGTFDALAERLDYLRDLGITAVELMPVAQFPGSRNWGYDGVFPYAPQNTYGGPEGLRRFVDRAHDAGLAVILDVVHNHVGPEGSVLQHFGPYLTDRYRTPWGKAINFDGPDSDEVRRYFIDNALYWVTEYHIDALRLDAVHAICDFSAINILEELATAVRAQAARLGRTVHVVAESDLNDPRLTRRRSRGGYELDGQWNDDFHHAVHAALTGERAGYYADFDGVASITKAMTDRFVLDGAYSIFRRRRHGAPARDLSPDRLVAFVQNHDQVGNRALGERLATLVSFERQKLAACLLLLSPYVPLLFMGEEYGEVRPFQYFVSLADSRLVEAVRRGRKAEFRAFDWVGDIPDPQAEETFARSRPALDAPRSEEQSAVERLYRDLLRLRREHPASRPGAAEVRAQCDGDRGWLAWTLWHPTGRGLGVAVNLASEAQGVGWPSAAGRWWRLLSTADPSYGGRERASPGSPFEGQGAAAEALVAGESALVVAMEVA